MGDRVHMTPSRSLVVRLGAALVLLAAAVAGGVSGSPPAKPIVVVFRYDDYSALSHTDVETKLINALYHYGVPATFGVIPYRCVGDIHDPLPQDVVALTPAKANLLKEAVEAGVVEAALHGFSHQTCRRPEEGGYSEFSGLDYKAAAERIERGKAFLESSLQTRITTFIPPWNAYDLTTLQALEDIGLAIISAAPRRPTTRTSKLSFLPATTNIGELQQAVEAARSLPGGTAAIVVLFHDYDFVEVNRQRGRFTYEDFLVRLSWITSQDDVRVCSLREATRLIGDLNADRYISFGKYGPDGTVWNLLPPSLRSPPRGVYLGLGSYARLKTRAWLILITFCLMILLTSGCVAFVVASAVSSRCFRAIAMCLYGGAVIIVLLSIYALRDLDISYRGVAVITAAVGVYSGIWGAFRQRRQIAPPS